MKASITLAYLLFQVPMVAVAQNDWEQHYSAAKDIFLRAQCMDGYREPSKNFSQHPEPVNETIANQMDLAVAEFENALTGLSKVAELVGRKKLLTLHALERAQRLGHHPEAASKTWQSMYGSFDENGRFHSAPVGVNVESGLFMASPEFRGSKTCPICYRQDGVVPITYGLIIHMPASELQPTNFEDRIDAILHKPRFGGCVVQSEGPNMFCNRCGIEFLNRGPNVFR